MEGNDVMRLEADNKTDSRSEFKAVGSKRIDVEIISRNIEFHVAVRRRLLDACPNNWMHTEEASGFGENAADAEADAAAFADVIGELLAVALEKKFKCGHFSCKAIDKDAECVFDWGLVGKPTKAVALPAATTKKHQIEVKGKWESKQKIGFGCFCYKDA